MPHALPTISDRVRHLLAPDHAARRCRRCGRRYWIKSWGDPCRTCRRAAVPHRAVASAPAVAPPPAVALTPIESVRYGIRLRRGLDLIAVSLLLLPVTPGVLMLTAAMGGGDDRLIRLGLLVMLEHGLWLVGVRVATEYAITRPETRGPSRRARWATAADAVAAMFFLLSLALTARIENALLDGCLYASLATALLSRCVALWSGAGAIAAVLRAFGSVRIALGLRGLAALACGVAAVAAAGLVLVLCAEGGAVAVEHRSGWRESGYFMLLVGLSALWCVALAAGGLCTLATFRLNRRFGRVAAALR